jgi:hypothetical protein
MLRLNKIKLMVLIALIASVIGSGCVQPPKETAVTPIPTADIISPTSSPIINSTQETPEAQKIPKLKIMSVNTGQATLDGIPVIIKVKNIGDGIAKDVYAGGIMMYHSPPISYDNYPDKDTLLNQVVQDVLMNGSSHIDTGFLYTENDRKFTDLIISSTLENKDYIGDISPGEIKTSQFIWVVDAGYSAGVNSYLKVVWTDDKKEYAFY